VKLVTNLAVFKVDHYTREFKIVSLHPGVTLAEVKEATGFAVDCEGDIPLTEEPDEESLRMIREEIDPLGLRFLESATGPDRQAMIDKILDAEEALIKAQGNFRESKVAN
jgi:hypothetical protein